MLSYLSNYSSSLIIYACDLTAAHATSAQHQHRPHIKAFLFAWILQIALPFMLLKCEDKLIWNKYKKNKKNKFLPR